MYLENDDPIDEMSEQEYIAALESIREDSDEYERKRSSNLYTVLLVWITAFFVLFMLIFTRCDFDANIDIHDNVINFDVCQWLVTTPQCEEGKEELDLPRNEGEPCDAYAFCAGYLTCICNTCMDLDDFGLD